MDKGTIVRLVMMVLAYVNVLLAAHNYKTIQLDEKTISVIVALAISAYGFYKNNIFGKKGKDLEKEVIKESEAVIEKVVAKQEPVVVPVAPSNQPIQPAPVAQAEPVQPTAPVQENK